MNKSDIVFNLQVLYSELVESPNVSEDALEAITCAVSELEKEHKVYLIVGQSRVCHGHGEYGNVTTLSTYDGYSNKLAPAFSSVDNAKEFGKEHMRGGVTIIERKVK